MAEQTEVFQAKFIPRQSDPRPEYEEAMRVSITSYPPLGQVSVVNGIVAQFTVLLETDESRASGPWEVSLWHSRGTEWFDTPLDLLKDPAVFPTSLVTSSSNQGTSTSLYFRGELQLDSVTNFTLKFRTDSDQPWKWVKDQQGARDGTVIANSRIVHSKTEELSDIVGDLNPVFKSDKVMSDTPNTSVWSVTAPAESANGDKSSFADIKFGKPWSGKILRWFALIRIWTPWLAPRQGKSHFELDKEGVLCSFMEPGGRHLVLLAISGVNDVMTLFKSDSYGNVVIEACSIEVSLRYVQEY